MNLNQITVPSTNLAKAIDFYKDLGLKLIVESLPRYARFECPNGEATFSLHHVEKISDHVPPKDSAMEQAEGIHVYFEVEDVAKKVLELKNKGILFDEETEDKEWLWTEAKLKDPDGNQIIIYNAGENRKNPPWRIN